MHGEIRVVDDVPAAFAALIEEAFVATKEARGSRPFKLAASGGSSGAASCQALVASPMIDFAEIDLFFVDERCVDSGAEESNQRAIAAVFADKLGELAGFHPMACDDGAEAYDHLLRDEAFLDAIQLGLGPDGHTASLFPDSPALSAPKDRFVVLNHDPSGRNPLGRVTMTFAGIALASLVVFAVIGEARAEVVAKIAAGEDFPAARVQADRVVWLIDIAAGALLGREHHE